MESRTLAYAALAALLVLSLETPAAARLSRRRRLAEEEEDESWAVRTFGQRGRPVYQHHGVADEGADAAAEESVRQLEVQAGQRSTPGPRYLPTPAARRKDAAKHDAKAKSTPGPKYLPTTATAAYTDADDVTRAARQETTWYTETSVSHVRSSTAKSDVGSTAPRAKTQEISNDVRSKPSHRRGRVRYRSSVSDSGSWTRNSSPSRSSRRRTTHSTTASSVEDKVTTPEASFGRLQTTASKRVTDSAASTTTSKPQNSKASTATPVAQNASANAHKSAGASTSAKKSKQDSALRNVGTLESQQIPASFWKSLREEQLNTAAEEGPETRKEVRETKDASSTASAGAGGKEVKAKGSAEANSSSAKPCSHSGAGEKGNHTVTSPRRKGNESAKASAAPRTAVTKATHNHASSKAPGVATSKATQPAAGRQASAKDASTSTSGGTTPIARETSTSTPEKKQKGSGSQTESQKHEASAKKAEPATDAKRSPEATTAAADTDTQQKATSPAS